MHIQEVSFGIFNPPQSIDLSKTSPAPTTQPATERSHRSRGLTVFSSRQKSNKTHKPVQLDLSGPVTPIIPKYMMSATTKSKLSQLNPRKLMVEPIKVFCEKPISPQSHITKDTRANSIFSGVSCFNVMNIDNNFEDSAKTPFITYERLRKNIKFERFPKGLCLSDNCEVRKHWVKMLRDNLHPDLQQDDNASSSPPQSIVTQVLNDIPRTCNELFQGSQTSKGRFCKTLTKILLNYARKDPEVEYVQGMNLVAAAIVNHLKEPRISYRMFEYLMTEHRLNEIYQDQFLELKRHCNEVFHRYVKKICPDIYEHLVLQSIDPISFMPPWFLSLFACIVPIESMHLVVNGFINGGYAFLYRLAISYMIYLRQDILTANEGSLMVLGTSFSRQKPVEWPQLIAVSHQLRLM